LLMQAVNYITEEKMMYSQSYIGPK